MSPPGRKETPWLTTRQAPPHRHHHGSNESGTENNHPNNQAFASEWSSYESKLCGGARSRHSSVHVSTNINKLNHRTTCDNHNVAPNPYSTKARTPPTPKLHVTGNSFASPTYNPYSNASRAINNRPRMDDGDVRPNDETYVPTYRLPAELVRSCRKMRVQRESHDSNPANASSDSMLIQLPSNDSGVKSLNNEQRRVVTAVLEGKSTFFTGPAGSGKSHVLATILRLNKDGNVAPTRNIVVTATTGIAACAIGGVTVHSFAGIGTGDGRLQDMVARVMGSDHAKRRWRDTDCLVIDEISMMSGKFLDVLDFVACRARNDRRPFGGMQLVVCGDFFQLPPVDLAKSGCGFAFESKCWSKVIQEAVELTQVFRQGGDVKLMSILNEARVGELTEASFHVLKQHEQQNKNKQQKLLTVDLTDDDENDKVQNDESAVKPTLLECKNRQVDEANRREMDKLPGKIHVFAAKDRAISRNYENQLRHCAATDRLSLKLGAQVILLKNLDPENGLVNGTRGVVVDFKKAGSAGTKLPGRSNGRGGQSKGDDGSNAIPREFKNVPLPVVQFDSVRRPVGADDDENSGDGSNNTKKRKRKAAKNAPIIVEPAEWSNRVGDTTVSSRVQIPLRLAWALSVHKSQGMTIPHLTVNLRGVFEYGQGYVALSRATSLDLLTLRGFQRGSMRAHPKVKAFYRLLNGKEDAPPSSTPKPKPLPQSSPSGELIRGIPTNQQGQPRPTIIGTNHSLPYVTARQSPLSSQSALPNNKRMLTAEQQQRMEENRKRALLLRKARTEQG